MSEKDPFKVEQDGHIAWLTLNQPDHRNIMGLAFFEELTKHFERFDEDPSVRGVVIKAEGKSFTAGLDLVGVWIAARRRDRRRYKGTIAKNNPQVSGEDERHRKMSQASHRRSPQPLYRGWG